MPGWQHGGLMTLGVTIKDMTSGSSSELRQPSSKRLGSGTLDTVRLAKHKSLPPAMRTSSTHELCPQHPPVRLGQCWGWFHKQDLWGTSEKCCHAQALQQRHWEHGPPGLPSLGLKNGENGGKEPGWELQTDTSGPRHLDRISRQVAAANKKHENKWCWVNKLPHL